MSSALPWEDSSSHLSFVDKMDRVTLCEYWASLVAQWVKNLPAMQENQVQSLGSEDSLKRGITPHSSILAWRLPWTEVTGRPQSMGSQRVELD